MNRIPKTQIDAFKTLKNLPNKRQVVYSEIGNSGIGMTLFELSGSLSWTINRVSGRVTELKDRGLIVDSGDRRVNPESGKRAIVWKASDEKQSVMNL